MSAHEESPEPEPGLTFAAGSLLYGMVVAFALGWLWWRDRLGALPAAALGQHGPWAASGIGLAVGCLGAWLLGFLARRLTSLKYEALARQVFGRMGEVPTLAFVLVGAVAEELFFRLAVQDALGLLGSVALCVLLHSSIAGLWLIPFALLHALALGLIVQQGFGLLGSTTAHSILNYLSLRRMLCHRSSSDC
ncbi:MAG: CPBP family glutamic-type intramembrane protease [Planctomycetota bacterium]